MSASAPASTRDAVLSLLLEHGEEDAGTLADAVGISVQAMRRHLRSLADSGLVCASSNASGPGRPSNRCLLYTSPSPRDLSTSRMPSSA